MPSENCKFHKRGHCKAKSFCNSNHDIKICPQNQFCNKKSSCELRHVKNCPKFPYCGFETTQGVFIFSKNCSYYHPPPIPPLFPHPPPWPIPPKVRPLPPDPMTSRRVQSLEVLAQKLRTDLSALGNELAAMKSKNNNTDEKSASEKEDDTLEVTPEVSTGGILENILTLSDETPDTVTGSASVGNQEKDTITATTKETKAKGNRSWWQVWPTAPNHPPPTSGAESGADTEKVLEGTPDDHLQLQHNDKNPDPGAARAQGITHTELEARLTKLQEGWNNGLRKLFHESDEANEKDLKNVEKETDRLLQELENRLEVKITNLEQSMKKQTTDLETKLGSRIINSSTQMQTVAEKIQDQFDSLKREEDTALVAADNKLAEQTDNTETLKHLLGIVDKHRYTLTAIIHSLLDLRYCKLFPAFLHKLAKETENELEPQLYKIN